MCKLIIQELPTRKNALSKEKITMFCKGTAGSVKGNVIGQHYVSECPKTPILNCFSLSFKVFLIFISYL